MLYAIKYEELQINYRLRTLAEELEKRLHGLKYLASEWEKNNNNCTPLYVGGIEVLPIMAADGSSDVAMAWPGFEPKAYNTLVALNDRVSQWVVLDEQSLVSFVHFNAMVMNNDHVAYKPIDKLVYLGKAPNEFCFAKSEVQDRCNILFFIDEDVADAADRVLTTVKLLTQAQFAVDDDGDIKDTELQGLEFYIFDPDGLAMADANLVASVNNMRENIRTFHYEPAKAHLPNQLIYFNMNPDPIVLWDPIRALSTPSNTTFCNTVPVSVHNMYGSEYHIIGGIPGAFFSLLDAFMTGTPLHDTARSQFVAAFKQAILPRRRKMIADIQPTLEL